MDFSAGTWFVIAVISLGLVAGVIVLLRKRGPREQEALYMRCPGCKRRLKYYPRQVGHKGACSNCKEQFTFPREAAAGR